MNDYSNINHVNLPYKLCTIQNWLYQYLPTSQALCAASTLSNSIKAKPLGSPVDLYLGRLTYNTGPQLQNIFFIHSWSTWCGRHSCKKHINYLKVVFTKKKHTRMSLHLTFRWNIASQKEKKLLQKLSDHNTIYWYAILHMLLRKLVIKL